MNVSPHQKKNPSQTGRTRNPHRGHQALLIVGALLLFVLLLGGGVLLPSRWRSHAAGPGLIISSPRCAEQTNAQNCENKDPIDAHCTQDAQTMASSDVVYRQQTIGRVDARTSATCRTAWTRAIAFPGTTVAWVNAYTVNLRVNTPRSSGNDTRSPTDGTLSTYTDMVFSVPFTSSAQFILNDGTVITKTVSNK